nr:hypothetical protein [Tanacetum cinerariifolium]
PNVNETIHTAFNVELSPTQSDTDSSHTHRPSAPIIEDWVSDSEDDSKVEILQNAPSFVQPNEQVKTPRPSVKPLETSIPASNPTTAIPKPKSHRNSRNRKACFVCKSLTHLIKDFDYYEKIMVQTPIRNHTQRGNHQQYTSMTLLNPQRHVVPTAVLTKSKLVPITPARLVTAAVSKPHVTRPRQAKTVVIKPYSPPRRHINRSPSPKANTFPLKVIAVKAPMVLKAYGCETNLSFNVELSPTQSDTNPSHTHRPSAPIIEDWVSDSEDDFKVEILHNAPSFVQPNEQVKTPRPSVKPLETSIPASNPTTAIPKPKSHENSRNRKVCFVCKSLTHLIKDFDYHEKIMAQTPIRNHTQRGNHQQYTSMTLSNPQRHVVPTAVLTKSKLVLITPARLVTAAVSKPHVTRPRQAKTVVTKPYSPPRRHINHSPSPKANTFPLKVTAVKAPMVNAI